MKYLLIVILALGLTAGFFYNRSVYWQDKAETYKNKYTTLKTENERKENADTRANEQIRTIKTIVKTVRSDCDCYNAPIDNAIIGRVRDANADNRKKKD